MARRSQSGPDTETRSRVEPIIRSEEIELEAVFWDLDGTLVGTERHWTAVQTELVESFGGTWTEAQALSIMGRSQADSIKVLQRAGVRLSFEEIACRVTAGVRDRISESVHWRPGAGELLADLRAHGKPHPEAYETAFRHIARSRPRVSSRRVLAIEDSLPGTRAARAAGLPTLGVPHLAPLAAAEGLTIWPTLEGRGVPDLHAIVVASGHGRVGGA
jgi:HAD superfamily hydrolase (TIGR01509 family)